MSPATVNRIGALRGHGRATGVPPGDGAGAGVGVGVGVGVGAVCAIGASDGGGAFGGSGSGTLVGAVDEDGALLEHATSKTINAERMASRARRYRGACANANDRHDGFANDRHDGFVWCSRAIAPSGIGVITQG